MNKTMMVLLILLAMTLTACAPKTSMPIEGEDYLHKELAEEKVVDEEVEPEKVAKINGIFKRLKKGIKNILNLNDEEDNIVLNATENGYIYLPLENSVYTSKYGPRSIAASKHNFHSGMDFGAKEGTKIQSASNGRVVTKKYDSDGWGHYIEIESEIDGVNYRLLYAHMRQSTKLDLGDLVRVGDEIGEVGNTGSSSGAHLHLEISVKDPDRKVLTSKEGKSIADSAKKTAWWWNNDDNWSRLDPSKFFLESVNVSSIPQTVSRNISQINQPKSIDTGLGFTMEGV